MTDETIAKAMQQMFRPNVQRMQPYVPGEQPPPGTAIKLNTNENPYPPSSRVLAAMQAATQRLERYPDPLASEFRAAAAQVLSVEPDQILCGNGSDDILTILTRAFVGPGDWIRFPNPSYILYRTLGHLQDANIEELPFAKDWSLGDAFFGSRDRLKLVYIPNPNSPTGTMVPREQVIQLAEQLNCPIVVDEAYVDFADSSCVDLPSKYSNILVTRTLSKSYALAGLRFGYLVAQPEIIATLRKVKDSYNTDVIANAMATAAISDQAWLHENVAKCNATRGRLSTRLNELGLETIESQANFVWCKTPNVSAKSIYESLKAQQIFIRYMNYPDWTDGLRISVGTDADIDTMLAALETALAAARPTP